MSGIRSLSRVAIICVFASDDSRFFRENLDLLAAETHLIARNHFKAHADVAIAVSRAPILGLILPELLLLGRVFITINGLDSAYEVVFESLELSKVRKLFFALYRGDNLVFYLVCQS